jgi:hypothetical protein
MKSKIPIWLIFLPIALGAAIGLYGYVPFLGNLSVHVRWLLIMLIFSGLFILVGWQLHRRYDGIFIDSRFKISLSRFQIILWTLLTFSALFTIALERNSLLAQNALEHEEKQPPNPLNISFPNQLLLALGISTASLAGASIIKNVKKEQETGKKLTLLLDEEKKAGDNKQEALAKINSIQSRVGKLADDESAIKTEFEAKKKDFLLREETLEKEKEAIKKKVEQADAAQKANPNDPVLKDALEAAKKEQSDKENELKKGKEAWNNEEIKNKGRLVFINSENEQAGREKKYAEIDLKRAEEELNRIDQAKRNKEGLIHKNSTPEEADWIDMFRGDEVGNYQVVDVSKVQMFFLTIAIVVTYGVLIWLSLTPEILKKAAFAFPSFPESMNALLGLSHAGYLVIKGSG